jgi:hypothetical protein
MDHSVSTSAAVSSVLKYVDLILARTARLGRLDALRRQLAHREHRPDDIPLFHSAAFSRQGHRHFAHCYGDHCHIEALFRCRRTGIASDGLDRVILGIATMKHAQQTTPHGGSSSGGLYKHEIVHGRRTLRAFMRRTTPASCQTEVASLLPADRDRERRGHNDAASKTFISGCDFVPEPHKNPGVACHREPIAEGA